MEEDLVRARPPSERAESSLRRVRATATLLDDVARVPGTRWRFGLDPVLGLVPGLGDWIGWVASADLLIAAVRLRAPSATLVRMAGNVALDALVGVVPVLGDLFDAVWKANRRNLALLERHVADPEATRRASLGVIVTVMTGTGLFLLAGAWAGLRLLGWLFGLV